jgi:hypothetical protein
MHKSGTAAGLFALLAIFLHMQFAPPSETSTGTEKIGPEPAKDHGDSQSSEESIEGPWIATRDYFHAQGNTLDPSVVSAYLQSVSGPYTGPLTPDKLAGFLGADRAPKDASMWSIVATVPDPLHTRMTLFLDGQIEAIERSMQAARWEFAGQWLPWSDHFNGGERDINERLRQRRLQRMGEQMPGILIFRSAVGGFPARSLLFIFLVPETATSGISGKPFFAALNLAAALASPKNKIGLLAPTFSGSFSSLTALIKEWQAAHSLDTRLSDVVYSGAVSHKAYADAFKVSTRLNFHAGGVDTQDYQKVFCEVLDDYHIAPFNAALLKEDETGYSNSFDPATQCGVRTYVFPRDISRLRNAYQEENTSVRDPYMDPSWNLNFSIRDPNSGEDSIPTFSEVQTPLTQDATVISIAQEFKRSGTEIVFIAAANTLDTLFLMRAIRRNAPDTRVLVENPEVLFVPAASRDPLAGSVLLSSYPMFADGEVWLDGRHTDPRLKFADTAGEGVFNVVQFLLRDLGALLRPADFQLRGYRQFKKGGHPYPGMWLLTLTRYGFLPLDYHDHHWAETKSLDNGGACGPKEDCGWLRANPDKALPEFPRVVVPPRSWRITVFLINAAALLGCVVFLRCNLAPVARRPYWLALTEGFGIRLQALLAVTLSLTAVEWILISPELFPSSQLFGDPAFPPLGVFFGLFAIIALMAPIASLIFITLVLTKRRRHHFLDPRIGHSGIRGALYPVVMLTTFLVITGGWTYSCYRGTDGAFFLRFRSLDLYSGSSPGTPLIVLGAVFFFISLTYFKRYTVGGAGRPRFEFSLASEESSPAVAFQQKWRAATDAIEQCVLAPSRLTLWAAFRRTGVGLLFLLLCLRVLGTYPSAFEPRWYNVVLWVELSLVLYWLAIGCYDFTLIWKRLRTMLDLVELLRLQPALKRVARDWPRRPVWAFRRSVSKHRLNRQMLYALHGRVVVLKNLEKASNAELLTFAVASANSGTSTVVNPITPRLKTTVEMAEADFEAFRNAVDANAIESLESPSMASIVDGVSLPGAAQELRNIELHQSTSSEVAARILRQDLRPWWRQSLEEDDVQDPRDERERQEVIYLKCCSDFVALQCCRYVAYGVEHIQRIASCVSVTFVLLLVFFNSYSPQGPQLIARFFAALFLVMGYLMIRVFAQMERNPILSRISRTNPGELNAEFWMQLVALGGLPLLGVLAHLFPSLSQFLFQWIAPGVEAAH